MKTSIYCSWYLMWYCEILLSGGQRLVLHDGGRTGLLVRSGSVFSCVLSICTPSSGWRGMLVVCCRCCSACVVLIGEFLKTIPRDAAKEPTERTTKQTSSWHQGSERCGGGTQEQLGGWPEGWADCHHGAAAETEPWCRLGNFPAECWWLFDWTCHRTDALIVCCGVFNVFETSSLPFFSPRNKTDCDREPNKWSTQREHRYIADQHEGLTSFAAICCLVLWNV